MLYLTEKQRILIDMILESESGWANVQFDSGGETYRGISRVNFPNWSGWEFIDSIENKKRGEIFKNQDIENSIYQFYLDNFYNKLKLDDIKDLHISAHLLDQSVNSGISVGVKCLQRAINTLIDSKISVDGKIGKDTISKTNLLDNEKLNTRLIKERVNFYNSIVTKNPKQKKFLNGWLNRVEHTENYINTVLQQNNII